MKATPVIPGRLYRVTGKGFDMEVIAPHPIDALLFVIGMARDIELGPY